MNVTEHGDSIIGQINSEDAYGYFNALNATDLYGILDQLESHFIDTDNRELTMILSRWMKELVQFDPDVLDYI